MTGDGVLRCDGGCGLAYEDPGWVDVLIPTDVWVQISPRGDTGGVMCMTCMARALVRLGITCPMSVVSGPWTFGDDGRALVAEVRGGDGSDE